MSKVCVSPLINCEWLSWFVGLHMQLGSGHGVT